MDLLLGVLIGAVGLAYFVYGKREADIGFMLAGLVMCAYPYFVSSTGAMIAIGVALMVAPFLVRRFL